MKTRILTAILGLLLFVTVLYLSSFVPMILTIFMSFICIVSVYELLHTTKLVKNNILIYVSMGFAAVLPFVFDGFLRFDIIILGTFFAVILVLLTLLNHQKTDVKDVFVCFTGTIFLSYSFSCLLSVMNSKDGFGLFYFLLIFIFAWGCDTGAYFTGVFFGKHKMAPHISPKKTIEGAIGGVIFTVILSIVAGFIFNALSTGHVTNILLLTLISPIFAIMGMLGDLIASLIKRKTNIKDYGKIMPGHGGILDRFDSLLLISPVFYSLTVILPFVKTI